MHAPVEASRDNPSGDRLNNVFVQRLQILELATGMPQARIGLAQAVSQSGGEIPDGEIGEEVDQNNGEQGPRAWVCRGIGRQDLVVAELQHRAIDNERHGGHQISPSSRQQDAGDHDDERVEKVIGTFRAPRYVDQERGHTQIGKNLELRLQRVFPPGGGEHQEK